MVLFSGPQQLRLLHCLVHAQRVRAQPEEVFQASAPGEGFVLALRELS